jgi:hypothetical protein
MTGQDLEVIESARGIPVIADAEAVVAGGGPAGPVAAAAGGWAGRPALPAGGDFPGPGLPDPSFLTETVAIAKLSS